jgi:hypothetical protein
VRGTFVETVAAAERISPHSVSDNDARLAECYARIDTQRSQLDAVDLPFIPRPQLGQQRFTGRVSGTSRIGFRRCASTPLHRLTVMLS